MNHHNAFPHTVPAVNIVILHLSHYLPNIFYLSGRLIKNAFIKHGLDKESLN